jgi:hypothetical protein
MKIIRKKRNMGCYRSVADYAAKGWQLGLRRMLGDEEMREWTEW